MCIVQSALITNCNCIHITLQHKTWLHCLVIVGAVPHVSMPATTFQQLFIELIIIMPPYFLIILPVFGSDVVLSTD